MDLEIEAVAEFSDFISEFEPEFSNPNMDWDQACEDFAISLGAVEKRLKTFHYKYSIVLSDEIVGLLEEQRSRAAEAKFFYDITDDCEPIVTQQQRDEAGQILETLIGVREQMVKAVRDGRSLFEPK